MTKSVVHRAQMKGMSTVQNKYSQIGTQVVEKWKVKEKFQDEFESRNSSKEGRCQSTCGEQPSKSHNFACGQSKPVGTVA